MPSIKIKEHESFDGAMRRFKRACEKAGIPGKLRQIEYYEKPTTKRKRKRSAAVKRQQKRTTRDGYGGLRRTGATRMGSGRTGSTRTDTGRTNGPRTGARINTRSKE